MRRNIHVILTFILIAELAICGVAACADTWALVIGVNGYSSANALTCAVSDASAFFEVLTDPKLGTVGKDHARLLVDGRTSPTRNAIMQTLDDTVRQVKSGDTLIFFFTGHGVSIGSASYLVPIDGQAKNLQVVESTCITADEIVKRISNSRASRVLLFIDACRTNAEAKGVGDTDEVFTDEFAKAFIVQPKAGGAEMTATFYACNKGESAYEWPEKDHGVFTFYCLEGLKGAAAPLGKPVTLSDLQQYVGDRVSEHKKLYPQHKQTPWVSMNGQAGSIALTQPQREGPPPPPQALFTGRISVSFPGNEDCKAKAALIDALTAQNLSVVDATDRAAHDRSNPIRVKIAGTQRSERRSTDAYGMTIHSLDMIVSIKVTDVKAGRSLGATEATGSMPEIGPASSRENDAAERAAGKLTTYIIDCLKRVKS